MKRFLPLLVSIYILFASFSAFTLETNLPVLAVVDFQNNTGVQIPDLQNMGLQYFESALLNSGNFTVADRQTVQRSITEIGFNLSSGLIDPSSAVKLGKMLGARYLISGNLIDLTTRTTEFSGYGVKTFHTAVSVTVGMRVVDAEQGTVFFIDQQSASREHLPTEVFDPNNLPKSLSTYQSLFQEAIVNLVKNFTQKVVALQTKEEVPSQKITIPINSDPTGADVEVGGLFVGNTPAELVLEEGKIMEITISFSGYIPWMKKIEVKPDIKINAKLGKEPTSKGETSVE